jgi:hypothetical protein
LLTATGTVLSCETATQLPLSACDSYLVQTRLLTTFAPPITMLAALQVWP